MPLHSLLVLQQLVVTPQKPFLMPLWPLLMYENPWHGGCCCAMRSEINICVIRTHYGSQYRRDTFIALQARCNF
jgi:hypothetical protein